MNEPKVNFLCIGAQKAGTTSLPMYLRSNKELLTDDEYCNDVYMSNDEIAFFSKEDVTEKSINNYEKKFDSNKNHTLIGEKTPSYCFPYVIDKIHKYNPNMKLIFLSDRVLFVFNVDFIKLKFIVVINIYVKTVQKN